MVNAAVPVTVKCHRLQSGGTQQVVEDIGRWESKLAVAGQFPILIQEVVAALEGDGASMDFSRFVPDLDLPMSIMIDLAS